MSGGHWNYMSADFELHAQREHAVWTFLAAVEHELDWGISHDTCPNCARRRVIVALEEFFDTSCMDAATAVALARDYQQNRCAECGGKAL